MAGWTEGEVNLLISQWNLGFSASVIAPQVGKTRNAVIGKAHRLKLRKGRLPPKGPQRAARKRPRPTPVATSAINASRRSLLASEPIVVPPPPVEGGVSILDLEHHHCRAVVGIGPDGLSRHCGAHKEGRIQARRGGSFESPYCVVHGDSFYQREAVIRERAD